MTGAETTDAALAAVARVRGMREQDSRHGLRIALEEQRRREQEAQRFLDRIETEPAFDAGSPAAFQAGRAHLVALSGALTAAQQDVASGRVVAEAARDHWRSDKTRLSAVEMLLERRAQARADALGHAEAKELDDVGARLWLRRRAAGARSASNGGQA